MAINILLKYNASPNAVTAVSHCMYNITNILEEASTHKSAKSQLSILWVTRDLDLWPFDL